MHDISREKNAHFSIRIGSKSPQAGGQYRDRPTPSKGPKNARNADSRGFWHFQCRFSRDVELTKTAESPLIPVSRGQAHR